MVEKVSTLTNVNLSGSDYLFVVLNESDYDTEIQRVLGREIERLGGNLGAMVRVTRPIRREASIRMLGQVREKPWPDEVLSRIESEQLPFILILQTDFAAFDPNTDNWFIVWLSSLRNTKKGISRLCDVFNRQFEADRDLVQFLETKLDGADPSFPLGVLSSRDHPTAVAPPKQTGKKTGILDPELGVKEALPELVAKCEITPPATGWQKCLAEQVRKWLQKRGHDFRSKSIYNVLAEAGEYEKIARQATQKAEASG